MTKLRPILLSVLLAIGFVIATLTFLAGGRAAAAAPVLTTWYVNGATGNDANDCLSSGTACETIGAAVTKASNADLIQIAPGIYPEALVISKQLTLSGAGTGNTFLDGENNHRVLEASSSGGLTLTHLTVRNGFISGDDGAGIFNFQALTLDDVHVVSNTTATTDDGGAGIFNNGSLTLIDSQVLSNTAQGVGGGIYNNWPGQGMTATGSLIAGNSGVFGGAVYNLGSVYMEDSTIHGNVAEQSGGGISIFMDGDVALNRVTISDNQATSFGAGIHNTVGVVTLTNVTVSGNSANTYTAIFNTSASATMVIRSSTIAGNIATAPPPGFGYGGIGNTNNAILSIKNTILANNDDRNCLPNGNWTSEGYNLSDDNQCSFTSTGDLQSTDPQLASLANYGGATLTYALLPGSPAIDAGDNMGCPSTDQRGIARPFDGDNDATATCDIGAYEARNQVVVDDVVVLEGDAGPASAVFTVTLAPTSTQPITVSYATANVTAQAGSDYTATAGSLTFNPGQGARTVTVDIDGDTDDEPDETFHLNLSNAVDADLVDGQGVGTIIDDDGLPSLTIAGDSVDEGNTGTVNAGFLVTLSPTSADVVTVTYSTADDTATAGSDYTAGSGMLTFNPGESVKQIDVEVLGDTVDEGVSEVFHVNLLSAGNANITVGTAEGTILDDDTATLRLEASISVAEGDAGMTTGTLTVTLTAPTAFPVTVDYATSSGMGGTFATPNVDYIEITGTLTFAPGIMARTFDVSIVGDLETEGSENFSVQISNGQPVAISVNSASVTILDDDYKNYLPVIRR